jgi:NAD(P)H-hydrate epimerase
MTPRSLDLHRLDAVRAIEARAMQLPGHDAWALMQRAAAAAFALLRARWPRARRIVLLCGHGNNGGDGYVLATLARAAGLAPTVIGVGGEPSREPAARACAAWRHDGGDIHEYRGGDLPECDLVVDALLGIGLDRAPAGLVEQAILAINGRGVPVLALDVPSGLDADTGAAAGACVRAALTASFIVWKRGLWTGAAAALCGERHLCPLDVPQAAFAVAEADARLLAASQLRTWLPPRPRDAHKGDCGHVLVIGGDHGFGGAALLAATAAARAGAGLVTLATRAEHIAPALARQPELMVKAVDAVDALMPLVSRADVIALGPGLGQGDWAQSLASAACAAGKPLLLDADALNLLAAARITLAAGAVLTPHPGEAARLLGCDAASVGRDRYAAVRSIATRQCSCVVLKGAGSLIADPRGALAVCAQGNAGMASGGMGDVLSGVIAAFLAQGLALFDAACAGVLAHALAGDRAARAGERGMLASDLIAELRAVVNP